LRIKGEGGCDIIIRTKEARTCAMMLLSFANVSDYSLALLF